MRGHRANDCGVIGADVLHPSVMSVGVPMPHCYKQIQHEFVLSSGGRGGGRWVRVLVIV